MTLLIGQKLHLWIFQLRINSRYIRKKICELSSQPMLSCIHYQFYSMPRGSAEYPNTIFFGWVMVRPVRAREGPIRSGNFVFATTFLTVVTIVVQNKSWKLKGGISQRPILIDKIIFFFWSAELIKNISNSLAIKLLDHPTSPEALLHLRHIKVMLQNFRPINNH